MQWGRCELSYELLAIGIDMYIKEVGSCCDGKFLLLKIWVRHAFLKHGYDTANEVSMLPSLKVNTAKVGVLYTGYNIYCSKNG